MQLQALLCRSEGVEVTGHLETVMEEAGLKMEEGTLSLQLLSFPHTGKIKQVSLKNFNNQYQLQLSDIKRTECFFQGQKINV